MSLAAALIFVATTAQALEVETREFALPRESGAVALAVDPADGGPVWVALQLAGVLARLDPKTGVVDQIRLGDGSAPASVALDRAGVPWVADGGRNALMRVDPRSREVASWPLPESAGYVELNAVAFDARQRLWFTGQTGVLGRLDPASGEIRLWEAPGAASLVPSSSGLAFLSTVEGFVGLIDAETGAFERLAPPTPWQGPRRLAVDARGNLYVTEWNIGGLSRWDAVTRAWKTLPMPGPRSRAFAVHAAGEGGVWISDFGTNAVVRFDPELGTFQTFGFSQPFANARQIVSRGREIWIAESGSDRVTVRRIK